MRLWSVLAAGLGITAVALLNGCGGGHGATTPPVAPAPPDMTSTMSTISFPIGDTSIHNLGPVGGIGSSVAFGAPTAPVTGTMTATVTTTAPAGAPTQSALRISASGTLTFYVYHTFTPSVDVTFAALPSITVTLPPAISTLDRQFFYAFSDGTSSPPSFRTEGPAQVTGQTIAFAPSANPLVLKAGVSYVFAFYATSNTVAPQQIYVTNNNSDATQNDLIVFAASANGNASPAATIAGPNTGLGICD
jgi:hypothetical protein